MLNGCATDAQRICNGISTDRGGASRPSLPPFRCRGNAHAGLVSLNGPDSSPAAESAMGSRQLNHSGLEQRSRNHFRKAYSIAETRRAQRKTMLGATAESCSKCAILRVCTAMNATRPSRDQRREAFGVCRSWGTRLEPVRLLSPVPLRQARERDRYYNRDFTNDTTPTASFMIRDIRLSLGASSPFNPVELCGGAGRKGCLIRASAARNGCAAIGRNCGNYRPA